MSKEESILVMIKQAYNNGTIINPNMMQKYPIICELIYVY